jgi:hypothetical protein
MVTFDVDAVHTFPRTYPRPVSHVTNMSLMSLMSFVKTSTLKAQRVKR